MTVVKPKVAPAGRANLREAILDAAVQLLRDHGAKAVSQSRVARAAGIPQGHLTYYFPRRADLLVAVARRSIEVAGVELQAEVLRPPPARAPGAEVGDLKQKALDVVSYVVRHRERTRMMVGLLVEAEEDGALRELLLANYELIRRVMAGVLGRDADDPDVDIMIGTLWGLGLQHLMRGDRGADANTDRLLARLPTWFDWLLSRRAP